MRSQRHSSRLRNVPPFGPTGDGWLEAVICPVSTQHPIDQMYPPIGSKAAADLEEFCPFQRAGTGSAKAVSRAVSNGRLCTLIFKRVEACFHALLDSNAFTDDDQCQPCSVPAGPGHQAARAQAQPVQLSGFESDLA
jgi:hypothetical protein